ncbi:DNA polymerase III subunit gamma and tau [Curtobacterium sp. UCD-KPL2560]|uniref:DNA polymerase III subunit gamma and tau n=1 Tax=Curtobacterium sp. UCD-KPL2560 TaxID=1885315 RepID=UPI000826A88E|nr:DNA polymerase III subunit gamma and tau [Curtobacterium sp. UCD-KPL2560]
MVTALYRRYRPENFAELIGQSQVTDPLRTALRTNRVNHAYLFSGPRGCGKTTSARILARCLNCAEGPTDTPCGVCPSCVELARGGSGSLDVIEIDAASHNGVDDARDLRDRAVFAPARDRYKIFILDEAHMVTPQGFNALLKLVEEPPEHVKFIFATTEPEKVIGTIRSRTHHYPFRLVPPATMLEYVEQLCATESVSVAPGVLPLVVRAGGGSVRDTLSLLDQLMAGSEDGAITYERAVALLGYTDAALLDDVVDALAVADPASAFAAIDRVVQTGQDPRRFVEDLLERLRDLIVVAATNESAAAVLRGVSPEELDTMTRQAGVFGATALSRSADIANRALTDMTGATSPRLHLELMTARMLVPEADDTQRGALARVERLERRVGVGEPAEHQVGGAAPDAGARSRPASDAGRGTGAVPQSAPATATQSTPAAGAQSSGAPAAGGARATAPSAAAPAQQADQGRASGGAGVADPGAAARDAAASWAAVTPGTADQGTPSQGVPDQAAPNQAAPTTNGSTDDRPAGLARTAAGAGQADDGDRTAAPGAGTQGPGRDEPSGEVSPSSTGQGTAVGDEPVVRPVAAVGFQQLRDAWPQVVEHVQHAKRSAWSVVVTAQVTALREDVLTLTFPSQQDVASFKEMSDPSTSVSELLRSAILDVLGLRVKFVAKGPGQQGQPPAGRPPQAPAPQGSAPQGSAPQGSAPQGSAPQGAGRQAAGQQGAGPQGAGGQQDRQQGAQSQRPEQSQPGAQQPTTGPRPSTQQQAPTQESQQAGQSRQAEQSRPSPQPQPQPQPDRSAGTPEPSGSAPAPSATPPASSTQAASSTPAPSGPVTDWVVAAIPATDPTSGAVPEHVEPSWSAPFGTTDTGEPVAPVRTVSDPAVDAALAAQLRPASSLGGQQAGRPAAAAGAATPDSERPQASGSATADAPVATTPATSAGAGDEQSTAVPAGNGTAPTAASAPTAPGTGPDVPVDDYPLDDDPYDDGAPYPDPGVGGSRGGAGGPAPARSGAAPASTPSAAPAARRTPPAAPPQVRRTPVSGRYGEAVVREILGAQFIEETALHEEGA